MKTAARKKAVPTSALCLELEREAVDLFVHLAGMIGVPKSIGELYGLLFVSPRPLSMADLSGRLRLSKGATSQGLKFLRNLGAVRGVYVDGDRRDHFVAETELRKLMDGFLREQVRPHLKSGGERLERMRGLANQLSGPDQSWYAERAERLQRWQSRAERMLPFVVRLTHL